jgi:tRNA pseudouridine38-40 synthase
MGATQRWRLTLSYRGTAFHGFAKQPGVRTVGGDLSDALERCARTDSSPMIVCAGRTDAGVHATAQVVHVDLPDPILSTHDAEVTPAVLRRSLNKQLAPDISVTSAERVSPEFDARHSAEWRRYRYLIFESPAPHPLLADLAWHVEGTLDVRAMHQASGALIGSHDFRCFCRKVPGASASDPIVRYVTHASVQEVDASGLVELVGGRLISLEIQAGAFCHQMVRSITGQLVEIGLGTSNAAELVALLASRSREGAAQPAPPQGLCLIGVGYPDLVAGLP